jgi:hypothetical protein
MLGYNYVWYLVFKSNESETLPSIGMSELPLGVYFVQILLDENKEFTYKIIKQ